MIDKAMGVDLGTTNSVATALDLTDRRLIFALHGAQRESLLPSAVAWLPETKGTVVGRAARARRGLEPEPVLSVKRSMGKGCTVRLGDEQVTPIHVSSLILAELAARLRENVATVDPEVRIRRVVITVPAHFKQPAMEDTRLAGEEAGLEVVELLHEPISAVIHFCWQRAREARRAAHRAGGPAESRREEIFLVYDLGGGTFDVSIIRKIPNPATGDDFQTLAVAGDSFLGGDDFDRAIAQDLFHRVTRTFEFRSEDPGEPQNRVRWAKLLALAEQIKIRASDAERVPVDRKELFRDDRQRPVHVQTEYTRQEVERIIYANASRSIDYCEQALQEARLDPSQIDGILMIGGSSRVPLVQRLVTEKYCAGKVRARCPQPIVHSPDICVGAGAGLKAAALGRDYREGPADPGVRVHGFGCSAETRATFRAELLGEGTARSLAGGCGVLNAQGRAVARGAALSPSLVLFENVPLAEEQATVFDLELRDARGAALARFALPLRHDPLFVEPLGINTSANVLSYRLGLEVLRAHSNEVVRVVLAEKLTPLPSQFNYVFSYPGGAPTLLFPMYGDERLIKNIRIPIHPDTPPGAEVKLVVMLDASQKVRCRCEVPSSPGPTSFPFEVESPEPPRPPTLEQFRDLQARVQAVIEQYRGPGVGQRAMQAARLEQEIADAFQRHDDARLIQRFQELQDLLAELDPAKRRVEPPIEEMEEHASQCMAILAALDKLPAGQTTLPLDQIAVTVEENAKAGREAAAQVPPDHVLYSRCFENLKAQHQALLKEYLRIFPPSPDKAAEWIEAANERYAEAVVAARDDADRRVLADARAEIDKAESLVSSNPRKAADAAEHGFHLARQVCERNAALPADGPSDEVRVQEMAGGRPASRAGTVTPADSAGESEARGPGR